MVVVMKPLSSNYASAFRNTKNQNNNGNPFGWGYCQNCLCFQNLPPNKAYFTTRYHEWVKYNEPDWHFEGILSKIKNLNNSDSGFEHVIGLSYKDTTLVELISKELNIKSHPSDIIGITNDWLKIGLNSPKKIVSDYIKSISNGKRSILIARRLLDHCSSPVEFFDIFNCMAKGSLIYIEINDYYQLVKNYKYDFLWNERTFYPFKNHIENIINKTSLGSLDIGSISNGKNESIVYSFLQVTKENKKPIDNKIEMTLMEKILIKDFVNSWYDLKKYWLNIVKNEKVGIIGASHKGVSFSQLFFKNVEFLLFDDSLEKKNKYHPEKNILIYPIKNLINNQVNRLVITVDEKWQDKLKREIKNIDEKVKLFTFEGVRI